MWKCTQTAAIHPKTIGEHLKRRRLELHLMQVEVGRRLGVHRGSVQNWERGVGQPGIRQLPAIIEFLGYDPQAEPKSVPEWIRAHQQLETASLTRLQQIRKYLT
jgi:transcriptional regulator with XRE-family HTH domain